MNFRPIIKDTLEEVIPFKRVILLDYPYHFNIGDNAIYLGEVYAIRELGMKVKYIASKDSVSFKNMGNILSKDKRITILLHGGGNFGDLWKAHHLFRLEVIKRFKDVPIIQLPQTIYFEDKQLLMETKRVISGHKNFTLLVRDRRSFDIATKEFDCKVILCPDMAFYIEPRIFSIRARNQKKCIFLKRADKESGIETKEFFNSKIDVCDWINLSNDFWVKLLAFPEEFIKKAPNRFASLNDFLKSSSFKFAVYIVRKGLEQLSRYEYIITDRLHGHILSLLLGKKHFLIEQKTTKLRDYYETWSKELGLARFVSVEEIKDENFCNNLHI